MRIAIATFGTRISPRFDCAAGLLIVDVEDGNEISRRHVAIAHVPGWQRSSYLVNQGVNVVLTGGIRRCDYFALSNSGMKVYSGLVGEIEEYLLRFLSGTLHHTGFGSDLSLPKRNRGRVRAVHGRRNVPWKYE